MLASQDRYENFNFSGNFNGIIDEIKVHSRALYADESRDDLQKTSQARLTVAPPAGAA